MRSTPIFRGIVSALPLVPVLLLSSCAEHVSSPGSLARSPGVALHGSVYGGETPISGAAVYLYAVGASGYNSAPTSLLIPGDSGVTTDTDGLGYVATNDSGSWSITGDYMCPDSNTLVYLVAYGGNPGAGANSAITLMAALGPCGTLTSSTFVIINEVTTVASAYALAQFANSTTGSIATSSTNVLGLTNSFANVSNMVNLSTGTAYTTTAASGSSGIVPQATINTLANILAACVDSSGAASSNCSSLFSDATVAGGTAPTNTWQAALNIALHPLNNVPALYALVSANGPFQPTLATAPYDWTVAINYYFSGDLAGDVAVDSQGNVWFPSYGYFLNKMSSLGVPASGSPFSSGFEGVDEVNTAIDLSDNVWYVAHSTSAQLFKYSSAGALITSFSPYSSDFEFQAIAVDSGNNLWASNLGYSLTLNTYVSGLYKYDTNGNAISGFPATGGGLDYPQQHGLAIDSSGNAIVTVDCYVGDCSSNTSPIEGMAEFNSSGMPLTASVNAIPCTNSLPFYLAIDNQGNYWVTGEFSGSGCGTNSTTLIKVSPDGTVLVPDNNGYPTGGRTAIDGSNDIWSFSSEETGSMIELSTSGTLLSTGNGPFTPGSAGNTYGQGDATGEGGLINLAIDSSGNIWEAQETGHLFEFIGLAPPVVTPIAAAAANSKIGALP